MNTYRIQVRGLVRVEELNAMSPHQMTAICAQPSATLFSICTDQSGMIGLLRHLNNLGLDILSVETQAQILNADLERKES